MTTGNTVARALELARGGQCKRVEDIRRQLKAERFDNVDGHLSSGSLKRQLNEAMAKPA